MTTTSPPIFLQDSTLHQAAAWTQDALCQHGREACEIFGQPAVPSCHSVTEDGSIWDLLPMYTSLNQPPQDVMTDLETLVAIMQSLMGPLPVTDQSLRQEPHSYLAWLHIVLTDFQDAQDRPHAPKLFSMTPGQQSGQIHLHQLRQPAKVSTQRHTLCNNATSNKFRTKLDTIQSTAQHSTAQHSTAQHSTASLTCARLKLCSSLTCVSAMQAVDGCWFRQHAYTVTSRCQTIHS